MDERAQRLSEAHEDERTRYFTAQKNMTPSVDLVRWEEAIRADERRRMVIHGRTHDRGDIEVHVDDTGFTPGARGSL